MGIPQELYYLQTSLSTVFDTIGLTQEIRDDFSLTDLTQQEQNQLGLLIEKLELIFEDFHQEKTALGDALDQRLLVRLGNYYYHQDDEDRALEYYGLSNQVEENEWAYFNTAKILIGLEHINQAYEQFELAIKLKPDYSNAYNNLGEVLKEQGRIDEAIECYKKAQKCEPDNNVIYSFSSKD